MLGYIYSSDMNLAELVELRREETTVTHQGRWKRTKSQQLPPATIQVAGTPPHWAESLPSLSLSLVRQVSANTALRQQFHYLFLKYHLPAEILDKGPPKSVVHTDWILQLQDVGIQSPALEASIAAFFAARVGRENNDMDLVHQSRSMYVDGLDKLRRALGNPLIRLSDETLAACMSLLLYEVSECLIDPSEACMAHQRGAMMLLKLRGPDASASRLGHSLLVDLRAQVVSHFCNSNFPFSIY